MTKMVRQFPQRQLSRDEYRRVLLQERRRTMRTVRNTLIGIAVIAALWYFLLLTKDKNVRENVPSAAPSAPAETTL